MRSLTKKMHKGQKGLTLIELLIVVAILGIIAAVVIPNLGAFMVTGRVSAANTELENVKTASLAYYADQNPPAWPGSSADLGTYIAGTLTGNYTFDATHGWVMTGSVNDWNLGWMDGVIGDDGSHGYWVRPGSGDVNP